MSEETLGNVDGALNEDGNGRNNGGERMACAARVIKRTLCLLTLPLFFMLFVGFSVAGLISAVIAVPVVATTRIRWEDTMVVRYFPSYMVLIIIIHIINENMF